MRNLLDTLYLPCGGEANFDHSSGFSYRCEMCNAVIGSVGMPRRCSEEMDKWEAYKKAGMWEWNYDEGVSNAMS